MSEFVDNLPIHDVQHIASSTGEYVYLTFFIAMKHGPEQFTLLVKQNQSTRRFSPVSLHHSGRFGEETTPLHCCEFCGNPIEFIDTTCKGLSPHMHGIFLRLIQEPAIRLHWVYLDY